MWFICGLGNPGKKYFLTRHNLGFDVVDSLIDKNSCELIKKDKNKRKRNSVASCLEMQVTNSQMSLQSMKNML